MDYLMAEFNEKGKFILADAPRLYSPVVSAGVHSCSPVAPQSSVFEGVVVADDAKGEFITEVFRFDPTVQTN